MNDEVLFLVLSKKRKEFLILQNFLLILYHKIDKLVVFGSLFSDLKVNKVRTSKHMENSIGGYL